MKRTAIITLFLFVSVTVFSRQTDKLYPAPRDDKWGYIDKTGVMVIEPRFLTAGEFTEGLAPVRENGTYGYIDRTGTFIISPKYDLAYPFRNGLATVYKEGKPFVIDKKERVLPEAEYKAIRGHSFDVTITETRRYGLIDISGQLIADTAFKMIGSFVDGLAVVTGPDLEKGVIDSSGHWIVPFGRYKEIKDFQNGFTKAELIPGDDDEEWKDDEVIIDRTGRERFTIPAKVYSFGYYHEGFFDGLAIADFYSIDVTKKKVWSSNERNSFKGAVDTNGKIVFKDPGWDKLTPFRFNRAFAQDTHNQWRMIDRTGKQVGERLFMDVLFDNYHPDPDDLFTGGKAFVKIAEGWVAIDTNGTILAKPMHEDKVDFGQMIRKGDMIFLQKDISVENKNYSYSYGFWDTRNDVIVKPTYHDIAMDTEGEELIYAMKDGKVIYLSPSGKKIWEQEDTGEQNAFLNIDHMNRGYYYASSKYKKELAGSGGWGGSSNGSKTISQPGKKNVDSLQVFIDESAETKWAEKYEGIKLYVTNFSNDTLFFDAQDSRLYLKLQARDTHGDWKDIEYLPGSWCGNSYHTLFLATKEQWEFAIPVYQGEFKTRIRAGLSYKTNADAKDDKIIYSNEIEGTINPGQLWNRQAYYSKGLMDPYRD
ncbi:MAG TPA: WG repeat-containing protein [Chitinophagaceae bacterium]|jgi:hypothetical protein|nr:WG repeat-containing protein [Chitinophagaceae bacterium]